MTTTGPYRWTDKPRERTFLSKCKEVIIVTFKGTEVHSSGTLPTLGTVAPDFVLTRGDLTDVSLGDYEGKKKILNIVPSLDTGICARSAETFNARAKDFPDVAILTISKDLPFAQKRFCENANIDEVETLSAMRNSDFGSDYGVTMVDGPLAGIFARAVVVLDESNKVRYTQLVPEITQEPDYASALDAVSK